MKSLISIIVPVYNVDKYLERCLNSILNQTYNNLEIILIDDGSTDNSGIICDKYKKIDKRIKVIHQKNSGLSSSRNKGLEKHNGDYLMFIDSDDYISNNMVETLYNNIIETNSDISICDYVRFNERKKHYNKYAKKSFVVSGNEKYKYLENNYSIVTLVQWNKLYNSKIFNNIKFPVGKIHEDEFVIAKELFNSKRISYILKPLYYYYERNNSITNIYNINRFDIIEALDQRIEFYKKNNLDEYILYTKTIKMYSLIDIISNVNIKELNKEDKKIIEKYLNISIDLAKELLKAPISYKKKLKYYKYLKTIKHINNMY